MLPRAEIRILNTLSIRAVDMALNGYISEGYVTLAEGKGRVTALRDSGEPWGEELVARYAQAMDEYAGLYHVGRA